MSLIVEKIAQLTGHNASIFSMVSDQDAQFFYSGAGDGWVVRWDLGEPELGRLVAKVETQIFTLAHLPAANLIIAGNMNGGVHWIDIAEPEAQRNIAHHQKGVFGIQPVGDTLFTIGGQGMITKWSIAEKRTLESLQLSNQSLRSIDYSPARHELAIGSSDNSIYLLDADTLAIRHTLAAAHTNSVFAVRYSPDSRHLLSGGRDAFLRVWDLENDHELVSAQPAHWFTINDIVFHPQGKWFATASRDKTVKIWDGKTFKLLKVLDTIRNGCHVNSVNRLLWSGHQDYLLSCSDDRSMIIWAIAEK
jgi:WD40 repeat protein